MEALQSISGLGFQTDSKLDLSAKDKRYLTNVEKALVTFDTLQEWADYIAFLSRLQKALLLGDDSVEPQSVEWIPLSNQVSRKLALCLSPKLPNGVHQKALSLYELIFRALTNDAFNEHINVWLPGFLPVVSYASMQLKPQVLNIYKTYVFQKLKQSTIRSIAKPVLLSLLSVIDDENSEVYKDAFALLDAFKVAMNDNSLFWQTIFLCITSSPERRLGALNWCVARLPSFKLLKDEKGSRLSSEAESCLKPEPGLLVRAFAAALNTSTSFNQANDIVVVRGFFDLLLSHLPLSSEVFQHEFSASDKELLIMACCRITLKKDMSLNRRLWSWLLGPELADESTDGDSRVNYFADNALPILSEGVLKMVNSKDSSMTVKGLKIALSFMLDRWEISQLVAPRFFTLILLACFISVNSQREGKLEILANTKLFFDAVEASFIWEYIICELILSDTSPQYEMLCFLLKNFDFHDQEIAIHIPLAMLCLLLKCEISVKSVETLKLLLGLAQPRLFAPILRVDRLNKEPFLEKVKDYYENLRGDYDVEFPIKKSDMSFMLLDCLKDWYVDSVSKGFLNDELSSILCHFLFTIPTENYEILHFSDKILLDTIFHIRPFCFQLDEMENQKALRLVLSAVKFTRYLVKASNTQQRNRILRIFLSNLWYALISSYPANNEVEAVRIIFDLELSFDSHEIEAGLVEMILHTPRETRSSAFYKLWVHSADLSTSESLLAGPLRLLLDDLHDNASASFMASKRLVRNILKDGSAARFLKLLTDPILAFDFIKSLKTQIGHHDDLKNFAYSIESIHNVIRSNEKLVKETLNHELVVSEGTESFELVKTNEWDISNYKSLHLSVLHKFLGLELSSEILESRQLLDDYSKCVSSCLKLFSDLVMGSEADFTAHFEKLLLNCLYYVQAINDIPLEIELVQAEYINTIQKFLDLTKSMNIDIRLLHTSTESKDSLLVTLIIEGIKKCLSAILLEKWFALLTRSLYSWSESVFSVILTLNDGIINKIKTYFERVKRFEKVNDFVNLETSFSILLSGLEDMLSISHSYLLTSSLRSNAKVPTANGDSGFLGSVILGVFQIESPNLQTEEQNRIYSVLISIQDASRIAFEMWDWAEKGVLNLPEEFASTKSASFLSNKLKFRSRKLLEALMDLERQEVIETIIESSSENLTKLKLLHVLDNGRPQITLPHIINSIMTRCYPQGLKESNRSSMNSPVTSKQLSEFLYPYFDSIDTDTIEDVWQKLVMFFKDVLAHAYHFKASLSDYLRVLAVLANKISAKKSSERKGYTKELADLYQRMITAACTLSMAENKDNREELAIEKNLLETLISLIDSLSDVLQDSDKVTAAVNTIVNLALVPNLGGKSDNCELALNLMKLIGSAHPTRVWRNVVSNAFNDNNFFVAEIYKQNQWKSLLSIWASTENDALTDLIARISPPTKSTAANIFVWNEKSELEDKLYVLKRVAYLILVLSPDHFANVLDELCTRIFSVINGSCPALFRTESFVLLRAIALRFDQIHLLAYWSPITQSLVEVFRSALLRSQKELEQLEDEEVQLVLGACKLLDQLLLLRFDEFTLKEWLFVETNPSVITDSTKNAPTTLIDLLAVHTESLSVKSSAVQVTHPIAGQSNKPTLYRVKKVESIGSLRRFFGLFSYINYEQTYSLAGPNLEACCDDVFQDLSVSG